MKSQGSSKIQRDNVLVAVRVRSYDDKDSIIDISGNDLILSPPKHSGIKTHKFAFDKCYSNFGDKSSQETIFKDFGEIALHNVFSGFNVTILAYGQTGSGKSYSMMGPMSDPGLIPRISKELFLRIEQQSTSIEGLKYTCEASYFEIYNEKVRDLLDPKKMDRVGPAGLTVREHPKHGPYVEDLINIPIQSYEDVTSLLSQGNAGRTVAATRMNAESSRSHAIFTLKLKQSMKNLEEGVLCEKVAHIHLVDLAGSERQTKTKAQGANLREAAEINKSLVTLGRVISALAESNSGKKTGTPSRSSNHIPFRDSTLTWLLKRSFGINGNSRTMLLCTVSSKATDYEESLGSLRYAARAKNIITSAVCNDDSNNNIVEGLKNEIKELTQKLGSTEKSSSQEIQQLSEQLQNAQKLIQVMNMSWEDKLKQAEQIREERENALKREGIATKLDPSSPFLYSLREDQEPRDCLVYYLRKGDTNIGRSSSLTQPCILLHLSEGPEIFCVIKTMNDCTSLLVPHDGICQIFVNGQQVSQDVVLSHGDHVVFGSKQHFRYSASMNYLQNSPHHIRADVNMNFAHDELQARLESVTNDLEKQRDQVKVLERDVTKNDAKVSDLVNQLEVERANKAELSEKLKFAIEETMKARRLLKDSESGFHTISKTQQRQLQKMKEELRREQSLRGNLAMLVSRIRNDPYLDQNQDCSSPFINVSSHYRFLIEALAKTWRASTRGTGNATLTALSNHIFRCNSMSFALGHEVLFDMVPSIKLAKKSPIPLLEASPIIRMKSVSVPVVCFSTKEFLGFYQKLREFYCYSLERQDNRKDHSHLDPVEHLKANPLQILDFVWGIFFGVASAAGKDQPFSISLFDGFGHRIGCILLKIRRTDSLFEDKCEIVFEMIGIRFLQSDFAITHPIAASISCTSPTKCYQLQFDDVPVVYNNPGETNEEIIVRRLEIDDINLGVLEYPFQVAVRLGTLYPENLNAGAELWMNARHRFQSLKRVSILKTPSICSDGSICVPGPSPRLSSARSAIPLYSASSVQDARFSKIGNYNCNETILTDTLDVHLSTRVHVMIEIQELIPSTGIYNTCLTKRSEDNRTVFKVFASKPKRFQIRVLQSDRRHFALESCSKLTVVAIRSEGFRDLSIFECNLTQVQMHIHDRYLIFRCPWPSELSNHSYAQRNSVFEIDIEISIYVDWHPDPIVLRHTVSCKAGRSGIFNHLLNGISNSKGHSGFFCSLQPVSDSKGFSGFRQTINRIKAKLRSKIALEKCRSLKQNGEFSPLDRFFRTVLDAIHSSGEELSSVNQFVLPHSIDINQCPERQSQPERSGFLLLNQRRVFCVLRYPFLQIFRHLSKKFEDDNIDLTGGSCCFDQNTQQPYSFKLQCKSKSYRMQASCEEDLQQWLCSFSLYMNSFD